VRKAANEDGSFDWEIAPVTVAGKGGEVVVRHDEQPFKAKLDKIPVAQARLRQGRHHHRGQRLEHLRRRSRAA
jgi:hypothetical protein